MATDSLEVRKIAAAAESGEEIPWVPVYRVPDIVFFSHKEHLAAGETCATCHPYHEPPSSGGARNPLVAKGLGRSIRTGVCAREPSSRL